MDNGASAWAVRRVAAGYRRSSRRSLRRRSLRRPRAHPVPRASCVERVARRVPRGAHQTGPRPRDRRPSTASAPTEPPPWNVRRATITAWVHSTPRHTPAMTPAPDPEGNTEEHRNQRPRLPSGSRSRCPRPPSPRKVDTPSRRGPPPLDSAPVQATLWSTQPATHALPPKPPRAVARAGGWAIGPTTVPLTSRPLHVAPTSRRPVCVHPLHVDADPLRLEPPSDVTSSRYVASSRGLGTIYRDSLRTPPPSPPPRRRAPASASRRRCPSQSRGRPSPQRVSAGASSRGSRGRCTTRHPETSSRP